MQKRYVRDPAEIESLVQGHGSCLASDRITVDGRPIGYMYRENPYSSLDSGWRFLAGDESDEYVNNPDNLGLYDVNTIANYDRAIIEHLHAAFGTAFLREGDHFIVDNSFSPPGD